MRLFFIAPVLALYLYFRAFWPLGGVRWRFLSLLFVLAGALFPAYAQFFGGGIASLRIPFAAMCVGEFLMLCLLNGTFVFLLRDLVLVLLRVCRSRFLANVRSPRLQAALLALVGCVTLYGEIHSLANPVVKETVLAFENLPKSLEGLRIVQLSDLHVANVFGLKRIQWIVDRCNALRPDLVVITGDFVDGSVLQRGPALKPLETLKAPLGVWACEGNHEHYGDYTGWNQFLMGLGVRFLRNENVILTWHTGRFALMGLADPAAKRFGRALPDIQRACRATEGLFRIALVHQPKLAPTLAKRGVDLMLSGHTHGGQTPLWSFIVSAFNGGFVRGHYMVSSLQHTMSLYVHSGTGFWTGFLQRIGTDNEIALITLKNKGI